MSRARCSGESWARRPRTPFINLQRSLVVTPGHPCIPETVETQIHMPARNRFRTSGTHLEQPREAHKRFWPQSNAVDDPYPSPMRNLAACSAASRSSFLSTCA